VCCPNAYEQPKEFIHLRLEDPLGHSPQPAHKLKILATGEMRIKVSLFRDTSDQALKAGEIIVDVSTLLKDFVSWLGRQGRSPAEVMLKQKLEKILGK